jgi:cellulose synthase/poly-beta-1,6-N-acetylglucosamine synthase-like glycosyltransferase
VTAVLGPAAPGLVLVALGGLYAWRLGVWAHGFRRVARETDGRPAVPDARLPTVTVVVPARNEEATIGACVDSILASDYPAGRLELIVVDDDSSDRTADVVRRRMARSLVGAGGPEPDGEVEDDGRLRLVGVPENRGRERAHKKAAIEKAVGHATGEVVLTTDADCTVPPGWVRAMATAFDGPETAFVSGPVAYRLGERPGLFVRLQAMDFFGLMACGAGGIGTGRPNLANGASVAYRRETFAALGGFSGVDHVTSGDDELLMQKVAYQTPLDVRFCADGRAVVETEPVHTLHAFVHQRRRWASKGALYPARLQRVLLGVGAFFVALVASVLALPFAPGLLPYVGAAFALKAAGDLAVLVPAARRFGQTRLLWAYPVHLVLHAPYSLFVAALGVLGASSGFEWKGRRVDR